MKSLKYLLILFISSHLFSQVDNTSLYQNQYNDTLEEEKAYFKLQGLGYNKDIENFGPMIDGYTLFGFQFNPQLGYQVSKNVCIEGGVYLRKDFGYKDFNEVLPTFSIRYHKGDFKMIFGNLDGSVNHGLIEPIYAFERLMTNRMETGVQYILTKKKFDVELWIDWQHMLYKLVNDYERLLVGVNTNVLKKSSEKFEFRIPIQGTGRHNGGQIARGGYINGPDKEGVYTHLNGSAGVYFKYNLNKKHLKNVYFDTRYVGNMNNTKDTSVYIYKRYGDGMLANIGINVFGSDLMLSYWYGSDYISEFGGALYSSESSSITYAGTYKSFRNYLMLRLTSKFKLAKQVTLTLRTEPQLDIDFKRFSCDFGLYLNFDKQIFFKK
ncbi:MAG: hypothetical protein IPJ60_07290 [Sphingobacteriaceae bacterium]|nr:hypothetical protein [Sphingobacteriaceae bacterium]